MDATARRAFESTVLAHAYSLFGAALRLTRSRAEAAEDRRRAREESVALVAEGRAEADQLRDSARRALERARAEIAQLKEQRDTIAAELGQLSGVIAALSVPERAQAGADPTPSDPPSPPPPPTAPSSQETPDA